MKIERDFIVEIRGESFTVNIINEDDIMANFICNQTQDNGDVYQLLHGDVKWDGCMQIWWDLGMHFCFMDQIEQIKTLLELIYKECRNTFEEGTFLKTKMD